MPAAPHSRNLNCALYMQAQRSGSCCWARCPIVAFCFRVLQESTQLGFIVRAGVIASRKLQCTCLKWLESVALTVIASSCSIYVTERLMGDAEPHAHPPISGSSAGAAAGSSSVCISRLEIICTQGSSGRTQCARMVLLSANQLKPRIITRVAVVSTGGTAAAKDVCVWPRALYKNMALSRAPLQKWCKTMSMHA